MRKRQNKNFLTKFGRKQCNICILNLTDELIIVALKTATNILKSTGPNYLHLRVIKELTGVQNSPLPIFNKPWNDGK